MSDNLRLFVGVAVDDGVRQKVAEVQGQLAARLGSIRWVAKENLHLTLKFLGAVEEAKVISITDTLTKTLSNQERIPLSVYGLGVFPNLERARILWARVVGDALAPLAERVEHGLEPLGFKREQRPFRPHLTVGRWRVPVKDPSRIRAALAGREDQGFGDFTVNDVSLFRSTLYPTGPVYSVLKSFHLTGGSHI